MRGTTFIAIQNIFCDRFVRVLFKDYVAAG